MTGKINSHPLTSAVEIWIELVACKPTLALLESSRDPGDARPQRLDHLQSASTCQPQVCAGAAQGEERTHDRREMSSFSSTDERS